MSARDNDEQRPAGARPASASHQHAQDEQNPQELYYSSRDLSSGRASSSHEFLRAAGATANHDKPLKKVRKGAGAGGEPFGGLLKPALARPSKRAARGAKLERADGRQTLLLVLFLVGLVVCVGSLACLLLLPSFVSNQVAKKLVLKNNSMLLERWSKPNVPMLFKVWLFDVKNAQELAESRDARPRVEEVGPFVFNLRRQKDVISFAGDNLYYTERRVYHFNRALSCCAINTTVTIPNIPLVAVVERALAYNLPIVGRFIPRLVNRAIQSLREQLFVRQQVREILFDGYDVELLRMVGRIGALVGLPQQGSSFALLKGRNDSWRAEQDGVWAINTGQRDRKQFGRVASWNSYKRLPFWQGAQCNVINGSDGTLFPPPIERSQPLYIFNQELCRTVNLVYERPSAVRSIQAYRFVLNPLNFAHTVSPQAGTAAPGSPTSGRLNPAFQNSRLSAPALPVASGSPSQAKVQSAVQQQHQRQQHANNLAAPTQSAAKSNDLKASASEQTNTHSAGHISVPPAAKASLLQEQSRGEAETLRQQERLIKVAQELANERRPESRMNPQTCFCDRKSTNLNGVNVCEFDGLIDLSKCSKQAQVIFGSMPHFHNSDPRLLRQVSGLAPNASRHTTYLDIEPNTGLVLAGKRRVQLNVIIKHNNEIDGFENIQDMLVPIVWFEESAMIPEESAAKFRALYVERVRLLNWSLVSLLLGSLLLLAVDARLLLAGQHWRRFKLAAGAATPAPRAQPGRPAGAAKHDATPTGKSLHKPLGKLATFESRHLAAIGGRGAHSNLPLLEHSCSSASSSSASGGSAPNTDGSTLASADDTAYAWSSAGETPPSSPELRKWAPSAGGGPLADRERSPTTTRIYLAASKRATPPGAPAGPPEAANGTMLARAPIGLERGQRWSGGRGAS